MEIACGIDQSSWRSFELRASVICACSYGYACVIKKAAIDLCLWETFSCWILLLALLPGRALEYRSKRTAANALSLTFLTSCPTYPAPSDNSVRRCGATSLGALSRKECLMACKTGWAASNLLTHSGTCLLKVSAFTQTFHLFIKVKAEERCFVLLSGRGSLDNLSCESRWVQPGCLEESRGWEHQYVAAISNSILYFRNLMSTRLGNLICTSKGARPILIIS